MSRTPEIGRIPSRREFLKLALAAGRDGPPGMGQAQGRHPDECPHRHRRCRAAGLAMANRLNGMLDGAKITLIDGRKAHYYQPGFTLVGAGLKPASYVESTTGEFVPRNAEWIEEAVAEFDPDGNAVVTASGRRVEYDFLVIATGLSLDYEAIEGMSPDLIGRDGIGSVYAGPQAAAATYAEMSRFADTGGVGLFGRPATEMKCAGAPLKYTFITEDTLTRRGNRSKAELIYAAHGARFSACRSSARRCACCMPSAASRRSTAT
jgi:sulfide:quinone oxidoreductase